MTKYQKLYQKSISKRKEILTQDHRFDPQYDQPLEASIYDHMIENAITTYELPYGIAPHFLIDGKEYVVPMVVEEPSVIAAASNAAKIIKQNGGFHTIVPERMMMGQIALADPSDPDAISAYIQNHEQELITIGNAAYPSIVQRGGGIRKLSVRLIASQEITHTFLVIYVHIDTKEAMGANIINTILETMGSHLHTVFNHRPLMSILSNLPTECLVSASCVIDPHSLKSSELIVDRMVAASELAQVDPHRTATHNKGIMNGIDALVIATGNDWRAINAAVYSHASLSGTLQPFTRWTQTDQGHLSGSIIIPLPVGSIGGSITLNPKSSLSRKILGNPNARELMSIIASVGLAQNFAALYALTTDGIQKGHMSLQARSLALAAGATLDILSEVVAQLTQEQHINSATAKQIVTDITEKKRIAGYNRGSQ